MALPGAVDAGLVLRLPLRIASDFSASIWIWPFELFINLYRFT